jgi:hypothetical protein
LAKSLSQFDGLPGDPRLETSRTPVDFVGGKVLFLGRYERILADGKCSADGYGDNTLQRAARKVVGLQACDVMVNRRGSRIAQVPKFTKQIFKTPTACGTWRHQCGY